MAAIEKLKQAAFACVAGCKESLEKGTVDLSALEETMRGYCDAVAELPKEEARKHAAELEKLLSQVTALREELTAAHEIVRRELAGLGRLKQANVAYQKSDAAIGPVVRRRKPEDD